MAKPVIASALPLPSSSNSSSPPHSPNSPSAATLPVSGDRIELMQTFVRIVEAGSLSAAAAQLGTTQPTVSRRLQTLERSLGVRLLNRSTHAMRLTDDGERCFERARELLANWAAFESDVRGVSDEPEGVLRVVAPHAFGQERLVRPLAEYLRRYPRMSVEWLLHDDSAIEDFIAAGIDCAIQVGEVTDSSLVAIRLGEVPRILVAAPSVLAGRPCPDDTADLADLPWLALRTYYRKDILLRHVHSGEERRIAITPRLSTDSLYALRSAALEGLGVAVGSAWVLADDLAAGRLLHLTPQWRAAPLPVCLVYPYARFYPARLRRFVEVMRHAVPGVVVG
ncbi:LysR family transcriptional regulator [Rhodocyclus tenuis]|uniref:LysR family transcriptional regulator n=1 Tax=Rhodocyclus tenuis TaxID=1066 RepID=A0A6L5JXI5_RHOTE|nr:LysR family transcriptional regulator [Rhodocyclus gracilis]MQY51741.1 LysR family transcriptional regulator [Rhodocyclus gracilis]MRD73221.1 LysR family transcriptional regulator [Rhodocyclus gracilis]